MTYDQISGILRDIVNITADHVAAGRRAEVRNERYFHHMFTALAAPILWPAPQRPWETLDLHPEAPTGTLFRFRGALNIHDAEATARDAVGAPTGTPGLIDLMIRGEPPAYVEWKGPTMYGDQEIAEVCLKLLSLPEPTLKVFAAILTSSTADRAHHRRTAIERFNKFGLQFALDVFTRKGTPIDLTRTTFYACIATIPDRGAVDVFWDRVTGPLPL